MFLLFFEMFEKDPKRKNNIPFSPEDALNKIFQSPYSPLHPPNPQPSPQSQQSPQNSYYQNPPITNYQQPNNYPPQPQNQQFQHPQQAPPQYQNQTSPLPESQKISKKVAAQEVFQRQEKHRKNLIIACISSFGIAILTTFTGFIGMGIGLLPAGYFIWQAMNIKKEQERLLQEYGI